MSGNIVSGDALNGVLFTSAVSSDTTLATPDPNLSYVVGPFPLRVNQGAPPTLPAGMLLKFQQATGLRR